METIKRTEDLQTDKSIARKLLNLRKHFSELGMNWQVSKGKKKMQCCVLHLLMTDGLKTINEVSAEFLGCS